MTGEEFNRLPMMLGWKQVESLLGAKRATWYRKLKKGCIRHPIKFGIINKWHKDYIVMLMEKGFEPEGTYPPFNDDQNTPVAASQTERKAEPTAPRA